MQEAPLEPQDTSLELGAVFQASTVKVKLPTATEALDITQAFGAVPALEDSAMARDTQYTAQVSQDIASSPQYTADLATATTLAMALLVPAMEPVSLVWEEALVRAQCVPALAAPGPHLDPVRLPVPVPVPVGSNGLTSPWLNGSAMEAVNAAS